MKVITAIGTPYLNERVSQIDDMEVICKDILYQEGVIELLESNKEINMLLVSNILPSECDFRTLINQVKNINENIEIVVFLDKRDLELETFLNSKQIYKIYELSNTDIDIFLTSLKHINDGLAKEVNDLRNLLVNKNDNINKFKKLKNTISNNKAVATEAIKRNKKIIKNLKSSERKKIKISNTKVVIIAGTFGTGKTIFSILLSQYISKQDKKVALIDCDFFNNSIKTMIGIAEYKYKLSEELDVFVHEVTSRLHVLRIGKKSENFIQRDKYNIKQILSYLKFKYDFIIIDTSSNMLFEYTKIVLTCGDKIIFLVEPNISEIKKSRDLLEIFINDFNIEVDKIKILFNKTNKYQIANSILEEIFSKFEVIGNMEYEEKYNLFINKNFNVYFDEKIRKSL